MNINTKNEPNNKNFLTGMKRTYLISTLIILSFIFSTASLATTASTTVKKISEIKQKIVDIKKLVIQEKNKAFSNIPSVALKLKNTSNLNKITKFKNVIKNPSNLSTKVQPKTTKVKISPIKTKTSTITKPKNTNH